jgi:O-antigen/teichoic acid export membrane protein
MSQDHALLIKDSLKYSVTKIIPGVMGLIAVIVFIRMIGAEEYGKYSVQLSFLMACSAFTVGWLNQSTLRYYSKYQNDQQLPQIFFIGLVFSLLLGSLILVIGSLVTINSQKFPLTNIGLALFLALCFFQFLSTVLRAQLRPNVVIIVTALQSILGIVLPLLLLWVLGPNHKYLLLGLAGSYIALPLVFSVFNIGRLKIFWLSANDNRHQYKLILSEFFRYGFPLSLWFGVSLSLPFFDRFFIEYFYGFENTGIYASFTDLVIRIFSILVFPLTLAAHPRIMSAWNNNNQSGAITIWRKALQYQLGIFIILVATVMIFTDQIFSLLMVALPELNISYSYLLMPILIGGFLWQFALLCHKPLEMDQRTKLMVVLMLAALCVNLIGNIVYLPHYGIIATAYTYMASAGVYIIAVIYFSRNKFKIAFSNS